MIEFTPSDGPTLGVEWEIALVDGETFDLVPLADSVVEPLAAEDGLAPKLHRELLTNTVEIVTDKCRTVPEVVADLSASLTRLRSLTDDLGLEMLCAGTHPFARWESQQVSEGARYATLIDRTRWWGRQMLIYGVHTHVGVTHRDKVLPLLGGMLTYAPHLQALSASSPWWGGVPTDYASNRAQMFQQLPTAGLPPGFDEWHQLEQYVGDMLHVGVIDQFNELRWDIRPAPHFGTLEIRVADGATNLLELGAVSALTHCFVEHFSTLLDEGHPLPTMPTWFLQENKWRSARYGMDAIIVTNDAGDEELVTDSVTRWVAELAPVAERLGCTDELAQVATIVRRGASYQRQRTVARRNDGDLAAVVRSLVEEMAAGRPL